MHPSHDSQHQQEPATRAEDRPATASDRRTIIGYFLGCGGVAIAGLLGIPALLAAWTPAFRGRRREAWRHVGQVGKFEIGEIQTAIVTVERNDWAESLNEKAVYVWRRSDQEFVVYSRNCTDLSCPVNFDVGSECFFCPCHGGIFDKEGTPLAGPPKRPLYRYLHRIRNEVVEIDLSSLPPMT